MIEDTNTVESARRPILQHHIENEKTYIHCKQFHYSSSIMAAPAVAAEAAIPLFDSTKYPGSVFFRKGPGFEGRLTNTVLRNLHNQRCIELANLPQENLTQVIHPIFVTANFPDLTQAEYNFLRPALRLASRFITHNEYLDFWETLTTGKVVEHKYNDGLVDKTGEHIVRRPRLNMTAAQRRTATRAALTNIAGNLSFFNMSEPWSRADSGSIGQMFMDATDRDCKQHLAVHGQQCGTCVYCCSEASEVCNICGEREYRKDKKVELLALCHKRGLTGYQQMSKAELLTHLETLNAAELPQPANHKTYLTTAAQRANILIGLNFDMIKRIREATTSGWSDSEGFRFQFAVATTLAHELAHAFWLNVSRRCWGCFGPDPKLSKNEDTFGPAYEIGNSWEFFAFGTRVPVGGRFCPEGSTDEPNNFQQGQFSYVWSTEAAKKCMHPILNHDFIVPVDYIHEWFQETTWARITAKGRAYGRPNFDTSVVVREEPVSVDANGDFYTRKCTVAPYDYADLVARNGFSDDRAHRRFLYGDKFSNAAKITKFKKKLVTQRNARTRPRGRRVARVN